MPVFPGPALDVRGEPTKPLIALFARQRRAGPASSSARVSSELISDPSYDAELVVVW